MTYATIAARKPATALESFLRPSLFLSELRSKRKASVLEEMVEALVPAGITRHPDSVLELVRQREALGSTGIGKGVAVPHARSTLISERAVLIARSSRGVEFDAADGKPVHLLFLIVAPQAERDPVYLRLLADIVRAMRLVKARQRLVEAPNFNAAREVLLHACSE